MQTVKNILRVAGGETSITDDYGKKVSSPAIKIGISYLLELDLRSDATAEDTGVLLPLPYEQIAEAQSFYLCVDGDWDKGTTPILLSSSNIKVEQTEDGRTLLTAAMPNTLQEALIETVNKKKSVNLMCEIGGYKVTDAGNGTTETIFCFNFDLILQNRLYIGGDVPGDVTSDPEYLKRVEIIALIDEYLRSDVPGPDGDSAYKIAQNNGFEGTEEEWLASLKGADGLSAYAVAVALGFEGTEEEWVESLKGTNGADGLSAYALAVENGYTGSINAWLNDLKGADGLSAYELAVKNGFRGSLTEWLESLKGVDGADGDGIDFDAYGDIDDKALYDDRQTGFRFLATVNDDDNRINYVYIWEKASDTVGDWKEPLVIKNYGNTAKMTVFSIVQPLVINRTLGVTYESYKFKVTDYPYAIVSAVSIITDDGEEMLPYGSTFGISKIIRNEDEISIYFGSQIMARSWTQGKIYFSQFVAPENLDPIEPDEPVEPDEPTETNTVYYGYVTDASLTSISNLTWDMVTTAINNGTMTEASISSLGKTSIGTPPVGSYVVVLTTNNMIATKDDGFGGKVAFTETIGDVAVGTNGSSITLNNTAYNLYGELRTNTSEVFIYVNNN